MKHKKDQKEKKITQKTREDRIAIVDSIKRQFNDFGIDVDAFEALKQLKGILDDYQQECIVSGYSGKFYVPELKRHIEYVLPLKTMTNGYVKLMAC